MIKRTREDRIRMVESLEIFDDVQILALDEMDFFTAPASTKYHGNYEGGLFDHSWETAKALAVMTEKLGLMWIRDNYKSPWIVGLLHDLCKCDAYEFVPTGMRFDCRCQNTYIDGEWKHVDKTLLKGHGEKSVMVASTLMKLTMEEVLCIRYHMGAYMTDDWNQYDLAIRKYPNVLYTHTADMIASKIVGV